MTDFLWGVSTAAYQIEGAVNEDGRGTSIWDTFCAQPGTIAGGDTGDVACDHYHRYRDDVKLMADLGVNAYRFSVAWPRVQPTGSGPVNEAGLDFYDRLVDELLAANIAPMLTLYHWDLPQPLEDAGGWLTPETAQRFAEYARIVADRLGDRVGYWVTVNEPVVTMMFGYATGMHAPGRKLLLQALPVAHHQLLGHGLAVQALRAAGVTGKVGIANNHMPVLASGRRPGDEPDESDVAAAATFDALYNRLFADPVLLGNYPEGMELGSTEQIAQPLDFYGVNYYQPIRISAPVEDAELPPEFATLGDMSLPFGFAPYGPEVPVTAFGSPVVPSGLTDLLTGLRSRYGAALPPIHITENGASYPDEHDDQNRIGYLASHLDAMQDARAAGVDVRGYFVWSLIDNFEWAAGYSQRFGLVHVDYASQARTPKASYQWYRDRITAATAGNEPPR